MSRKFYFLIFAGLSSIASAAYNCTTFSDRNHGFGCEMRNVIPSEENFEIETMSRYDTNKTDSDVTWVQLRDSKFANLPKGVFEKFENMEKIMILASTGFQILNTSYFDKKITLILFKNTDLEEIGENAFPGLNNLNILSLNYNHIKKVHKNAFRDLVNVDKIEMVSNEIESLDEDIFQNNIKLRLLLLYNNKLKVISSQFLSRNTMLESLQVQNNSISQVEKDFHRRLTKLTRADFSSNDCISESIILVKFEQWSSQLVKFKNCFNNYALMKSTNVIISNVQGKMNEIDSKINTMVEKVDNDLKILENKMGNNSEFQELKSNLVNIYKNDQKAFEESYKNDLTNLTSAVRTDLMDEVKKNVVEVLQKSQHAEQSKLVTEDFESLRAEFSGKFILIYCTLFFIICFACIAAFLLLRGQSLYPLFYSRSQGDDGKLIESEVC